MLIEKRVGETITLGDNVKYIGKFNKIHVYKCTKTVKISGKITNNNKMLMYIFNDSFTQSPSHVLYFRDSARDKKLEYIGFATIIGDYKEISAGDYEINISVEPMISVRTAYVNKIHGLSPPMEYKLIEFTDSQFIEYLPSYNPITWKRLVNMDYYVISHKKDFIQPIFVHTLSKELKIMKPTTIHGIIIPEAPEHTFTVYVNDIIQMLPAVVNSNVKISLTFTADDNTFTEIDFTGASPSYVFICNYLKKLYPEIPESGGNVTGKTLEFPSIYVLVNDCDNG